MSRIYEALKRSNDAKPALISQSIDAIRPEIEQDLIGRDYERQSIAPGKVEREREVDTFANPAIPLPSPGRYATVSIPLPLPPPAFPFDGSSPIASEQYRVLRTNLMQHPLRPKVIAVSSASPGDGKSVTTVNLAGTFALRSDSNVLIIDADLRRCGVADVLRLDSSLGLTDVLRGQCRLDDAIVRIDQMPNLHVLPARRSPKNPAELLDSPAWKMMISALREQFSYILIDTTPVGAVADFKLVQEACDGVIMVVRPDHTNRSALTKSLEIEKDGKLLGLVVNSYDEWFLWDTKRSYGYYHS